MTETHTQLTHKKKSHTQSNCIHSWTVSNCHFSTFLREHSGPAFISPLSYITSTEDSLKKTQQLSVGERMVKWIPVGGSHLCSLLHVILFKWLNSIPPLFERTLQELQFEISREQAWAFEKERSSQQAWKMIINQVSQDYSSWSVSVGTLHCTNQTVSKAACREPMLSAQNV